jgi:hypothetical protein
MKDKIFEVIDLDSGDLSEVVGTLTDLECDGESPYYLKKDDIWLFISNNPITREDTIKWYRENGGIK